MPKRILFYFADAEESREKGSIRIFNIPGIVVLFLHVFIYRTAISAVFSGASVFFSSTVRELLTVISEVFGGCYATNLYDKTESSTLNSTGYFSVLETLET